MASRALLLLALVGCGADSGSGLDSAEGQADRIWEREFDTQEGRFHVVLSPSPDPPVVGSFALGLHIARNNDNPDLDGALLVNAGVHVFGERPSGGGDLGGDIKAEELGAGDYEASWAFAHSGIWHLRIEIGAGEDTDIALIGLVVED